MRIGIGAKLSAGFFVLLALMMASGAQSYVALTRLEQQYGKVAEETYPLALAAEQLNSEIQLQAQLTMAYAANRDDRRAQVADSRKRVDLLRAQLLAAGANDPEIASQASALQEQQTRFDRMVDGLFANGEQLQANQLVLQADNARSLGESLGKQTSALRGYLMDVVHVAIAASRNEARRAVLVLGAVILLSVVLGLGVTSFVYRLVALPLRAVAHQLRDIASGEGDLTQQLTVTSHDEIGVLADSFNQLVRGLSAMVRRVTDAADELLTRSQQMDGSSYDMSQAVSAVSLSATQVAAGAERQAAETESARTTIEELASAIGQIAGGAQQQAFQVQQTTEVITSMVAAMEAVAQQARSIANASREAAATAHRGAEVVDQTLLGMNQVRDQVVGAAAKVSALGEHGKRIGEIMQVITEIANQTNLLALNAAIEAARAGEQGRGFAVVAEEVRKLAERSAMSANETRTMVDSIRRGTEEAVSAIAAGTTQVEEGAQLASVAGLALKNILSTVENTTAEIQGISEAAQSVLQSSRDAAKAVEEVAAVTEENSAATEEMAAGADEVRGAIESMNRITVDNAAAISNVSASIHHVDDAMTEVADSARLLSSIAAELRSLVGQFRI